MCFPVCQFGTDNLQVFNEWKLGVESAARIYFKYLQEDYKVQCQFFVDSQVTFTKRSGKIVVD